MRMLRATSSARSATPRPRCNSSLRDRIRRRSRCTSRRCAGSEAPRRGRRVRGLSRRATRRAKPTDTTDTRAVAGRVPGARPQARADDAADPRVRPAPAARSLRHGRARGDLRGRCGGPPGPDPRAPRAPSRIGLADHTSRSPERRSRRLALAHAGEAFRSRTAPTGTRCRAACSSRRACTANRAPRSRRSRDRRAGLCHAAARRRLQHVIGFT